MFQDIINQFTANNKSKIKNSDDKENIVLFDRSLHDQVIRGSLSVLAFNDIFGYQPIVVTDKSNKDWQTRVYRSFGIKKFMNCWSLKTFIFSPFTILLSIFYTVKYIFLIYKKGFHWFIDNFSIKGAECGDLIYDAYIRKNLRFLNPKFYNPTFIGILLKSIFKIIFFIKLFKKKKIKLVISNSVTSASNSAIGLRVAASQNIKIFFSSHNFAKFYERYDDTFIALRKLSVNDINKFKNTDENIKKTELYFDQRMEGVTHGDFAGWRDLQDAYQNKKNLTTEDFINLLKLKENKIKKVNLFAVHLFADAAHVGGRFFLFRDYYSQFKETLISVKKKNDKEVLWLIKPHPSAKYHNEDKIVEQFIKNLNYENIAMYPKHINLKSSLTFVDKLITGRGNIGLEYACLGKKPIIAGVNYYSDLGFISFPKSKEEYFNLIFDKTYDNKLNNEQILNAKKTMYLLDHAQVEKIKRGNIIPEKKTIDYKMPTETYFKKIIENLKLTDFQSDEYYLDLKKFINSWMKL